MTMEQTRNPRPAQTITEPVATGFVACACCGEGTEPRDLYTSAEGKICQLCQADREVDDVQTRGARDLSMTVFFSPGYVAMGLAICFPLIHFLTPYAGQILSVVPFLCMAIGANAIRTGITLPDTGATDRARLIAAGLFSMTVLGLMAAGMSGLLAVLAA